LIRLRDGQIASDVTDAAARSKLWQEPP